MPTTLLEETFWARDWLPSASLFDSLHSALRKSGTATTRELAEHAVRATIEAESNEQGYRVYSPEQKYTPGEVIFFLTKSGRRFAQVLYVNPGHSTSVDGHRIAFDSVCVRYAGDLLPHEYVSNCPSLPLRFSGKWPSGTGEYMTPATIVTRFYEAISGRLRTALTEDGRFVVFGDTWASASSIIGLKDRQLQTVLSLLRERGSMSCSGIAEFLFSQDASPNVAKTRELSIATSLSADSLKRFLISATSQGLVAALSPPAREVVFTLTSNCLETGSLVCGRELRKMLDFYELGSPLTLKVYGDYEIRGTFDEELNRVFGNEIRDWFLENRLEPGHQIHLRAPDPGDTCLRLYTLFEDQESSPPSGTEPEHKYTRKYLRHLIYALLQERMQYLHYREITDLLAKQRVDARAGSVEAILSYNTHLFVKREPASGLWGLASWQAEDSAVDISPISLLMAIGEEKWVWRVLKDTGVPMFPKEISIRLAELFVVRVTHIRELSFMDITDPDLLQLVDGRWALKEWVTLWTIRERSITEALQRLDDLHREVAELERQITTLKSQAAAVQSRVAELENWKAQEERNGTEAASRLVDCQAQCAKLESQHKALAGREAMLRAQRPMLTNAVRIGAGVSLVSFAAWLRLRSVLALYLGSGFVVGALFALVWRSRTAGSVLGIQPKKSRIDDEVQSAYQQAADLQARIEQSHNNVLRGRTQLEELQQQLKENQNLTDELGNKLNDSMSVLDQQDENQLVQERAELRMYLQLLESPRRSHAS